MRLFTFHRVFPSWEQIRQFRQPLTAGELCLLKFLDENLRKDEFFQDSDLTKYDGWLIFVQPFLNGCRPDIVIFNPSIGVQIFEVKDWDLDNYSFETKKDGDKSYEAFCVSDSHGTYRKKSPVKQVEHYKEKIAEQLIPQIGERFDETPKYYGVIKTALYFHKSTTVQARAKFQSQVKDFSTFPIIGCDALQKTILAEVVPDSRLRQSKYWQKDWNKELLFWLKPPFHTIEQGTRLTLTKEQVELAKPNPGHHRVRGVAGSGKTQVLAYRASELASQGYRVLVLTYNLTLWHLIHDMVQRSPFAFSGDNLTITYFHGFCKDIFNEFAEEWPVVNGDNDILFKEVVPNKVLEILNGSEWEKYDAILIDEGQDFCAEWYIMLCRFLTSRDEVVVVCDKKQNIYARELEWLNKTLGKRVDGQSRVGKFGKWVDLKKIYRLPEQVAKISVEFSEKFDLNQDISIITVERPNLFNQFQDHVVWWNIRNWDDWLDKVDKAFEIIKNQATHNHPSDTVILLPGNKKGVQCVDYFKSKKNVEVNHVFEDGYDKKYHRHKKAFWMGDSRLKMSTIHSFKGWEVPNVIVVIPTFNPNDKKLDMIVYTAMTRSQENLIIINANVRYREFGEDFPHEWS